MSSQKQVPAIGLDIGTSRVVAARQATEGYAYNEQLNAFVDLPWSNLTAATLRKEGIPHAADGSRIVVLGSESARFADLLGIETRRSMLRGVLNPAEPEGLSQMRRLLEHVAGLPEGEGQKLCFSVPAPGTGNDETVTYHETSLRQMLREMGYDARSISEGLAVVYAELEASNYSGIGISFGGGLCNVCLAYLSVPVAAFSVPKAGDFIDMSAAAATGELVNRIRLRKEENFHFNGYVPDKALQALSVYYDDMIAAVVGQMRENFAACGGVRRFRQPVPLVLSGGTALPGGFRERFEQQLQSADLPVPVSEVRISPDPLHSTAKGALIAVLSEA
jgi:hypothetical protein